MASAEEEVIPGYTSVEEFSKKGCKVMVAASRAFQTLPSAGSPTWDLRKSYPEFNRGLKANRSRLISNMMMLLQHTNVPPNDFRRRDVDEKFEFIVDANDEILERIATSLDKAEGLFKRAEMLVVNPNAAGGGTNPPGIWKEKKLERLNNGPAPETTPLGAASPFGMSTSSRKIKKAFYRNKVKEKPQLKFTTPVDNSVSPFIPKLREKPYSIKPLSILPEYTLDNEEFYGHPYAVELNQWKPVPFMLEHAEPQLPPSLESTPCLLVETSRQMEQMLSELENVKEIAVDVEHHSYRSYLGITCLIQISTRTKDYIVDGISLRDEIHHLNTIFANPKILKVFHSAQMDIPWLQKDFGVYVVGMFDTAVAAKTLNFSQTSLQYLLSELCHTSTDKSFQLADWRIRPLPDDMIAYARKDTHYLLNMYDQLRNRLIDGGNDCQNILRSVYDQSQLVCLKRYEKPANNPQVAIRKCKKALNNRQLHGFIALFKWRDALAREKDESLGFVLPNHMLLTIAETLPKEMTGIFACCDPVPILVSQNLGVIHQIITEARLLPMHHQETSMHHKVDVRSRQKNWMIMIDSIHEVSISEAGNDTQNAENSPIKSSENEWWKSVDWTDLKVKEAPKILFGGGLSSPKQNKLLSPKNTFTPYRRYKITNEIIRNLKDPQKKTEVDLENPLVKSVVETILVDPNEQVVEVIPQAPKPARKSALLDNDFVPFNPMSVPQDKRAKNKKRKHEEDDKSVTVNSSEEKSTAGPDLYLDDDASAVVSDNDEEFGQFGKVPKFMAVPQEAQTNKKSRSKKQRKNFLKKLTNRGKKRKYELETAQKINDEEPEDGEIVDECNDIKETIPSSSKKLKQSPKLTNYISLERNRNQNTPRGGGRGRQRGQQGTRQDGKKGGKKKGFWNFSSVHDGKSITFK